MHPKYKKLLGDAPDIDLPIKYYTIIHKKDKFI